MERLRMRLMPKIYRASGIYALFILGLLGWIARLLSAPDWIEWILFVPFVVVGIWVIVGLLRGEE
jgi:uncharacterized protein involved in cysteine biosynthesis